MASWEEFAAAGGAGEKDAGAGALPRVEAWSDGSSRGNPGPGGYGTVLRFVMPDGTVRERELSRGYRRTTNNRMELMGAIVALEALRRPCSVTLTTDSRYVCDAFNESWIGGWLRRGWKTASKQPVKNVDLWQRLLAACEPHEVTWVWVKGHAGHPENVRCDELATAAADGQDLVEDVGYTE